jgi:pyruvate dehydrogenase E2 component (dihydrolipoamide acetyltransferase)
VDSLLAIIGPAGTDISGIATNFKADANQKKVNQFQRQNRIQQQLQILWQQEEATDGKNLASPLASKKIASDKGIQFNKLKGSGENGRIISDIEFFNYCAAASCCSCSGNRCCT